VGREQEYIRTGLPLRSLAHLTRLPVWQVMLIKAFSDRLLIAEDTDLLERPVLDRNCP
jgi:hypothetical protein